jgi:hypothetical protein
MNRLPAMVTTLAVTSLILLSGCSWFGHKHAKADDGDAKTTATTETAAATTDAATAESVAEAPAAPVQPPAALAEDFYVMHRRLGNSGLPDVGAMNAYNAFLCPSLGALILDARKRQQQYIAANPDDKPPLIEGDLFSSLFEGPDTVKATDTVVNGNHARVTLAMRYESGAKATKWNDTAVLALDDGIWCLEDVEYQGKWPFANRGRLSESLKAEF